MDRSEAEAILDGDRETAITLLLRIGELMEANRRLEARVADLEQRLNRTSRNSSLPPSLDPPSAPPRPPGPQSGRTRGGQIGHQGNNRRLLPAEQVDEIHDHFPQRCRECGHVFPSEGQTDAAPVERHQLSELPPIAVLNRVSRRDTVELLRELFGAELSTGAVDTIVSRAGDALAEPHDELLHYVQEARSVNIDETGWRTAGTRRTLWGILTEKVAVFHIAPDRHRREAQALLGPDFSGIACSDRWWAYDYLDPERRQFCWAHLVRDFTAHSEGRGAQKAFGLAGLAIAERMFGVWGEPAVWL